VVKLIPSFYQSPTGTLSLASAFNNDTLIVSVLNNGATFTLNGGGGDVALATVAVPEPDSFAILGAGMLVMGLIARRRILG
jgi:hypothetical protein